MSEVQFGRDGDRASSHCPAPAPPIDRDDAAVWAVVQGPGIWTLWIDELDIESDAWWRSFGDALDDLTVKARARSREVLDEGDEAGAEARAVALQMQAHDDRASLRAWLAERVVRAIDPAFEPTE